MLGANASDVDALEQRRVGELIKCHRWNFVSKNKTWLAFNAFSTELLLHGLLERDEGTKRCSARGLNRKKEEHREASPGRRQGQAYVDVL